MGSVVKSERRLAVIVFAAAAVMALSAPPAQATSLSTLRPTEITPTSAVLHGTVDSGGLGTRWQFVYGTTTRYGDATPALTIPVGIGADYVVAFISGLRPRTTYHYRLSAVFGLIPNYVEMAYGKDLSFTTEPAGRVSSPAQSIPVAGSAALVPLRCRSTARCTGRLTLRTGGQCGAGSFAVPAGKTRTIHAGLRPSCGAQLRRARGHRIGARLIVTPTSGQLGLSRVVTLALG